MIIATGCTTSTKNFESGVIPDYAPIEQEKVTQNRYALENMMDEQDLELQQSGESYDRVKRIINRLSEAANVEQELDVYVVDAGDNVNAFAMGGNTIVVYQELIDRLPVDEELAVILGHEMAHILGQHNFDDTEQKRGAAWGIASAVVGVAVTIATDGSSLAGDLAQTGTEVVGTGIVRSYGRAMEHEADHVGMLLMAKAGYNPATAISVWSKANTVLGKSGGPSFFSSHPSHGNRKERLEKDFVLAEPIYEESKK
ncbi:MAG: M48 family metallopeptidase [Arenicella sp.]